MNSLREFFVSSSGLAPVRQGLGLGWVISALTWVAILLGAGEAAADNDDCDEEEWTREKGYSAGCDEATDGARAYVCQDCWLDSNCKTRCGGNYCCA
ncbi:MAG: hypothetical protein F4X75_22140 [Gemmatimonadetes bacterium]|nr:hypothetical protein [Gemmatimonadota bacterium]